MNGRGRRLGWEQGRAGHIDTHARAGGGNDMNNHPLPRKGQSSLSSFHAVKVEFRKYTRRPGDAHEQNKRP